MKINHIFVLFIIGICVYRIKAQDSDGNGNDKEKSLFRNLVKPFRMEKLNLIWVKAQQVCTIVSALFPLHVWLEEESTIYSFSAFN